MKNAYIISNDFEYTQASPTSGKDKTQRMADVKCGYR